MALNIKDPVAERLAAEVAELAHENKTEAIRNALQERKERLELKHGRSGRSGDFRHFLETEIWPLIPEEALGEPRMTKAEREEILGIGPDGV